MHALKFRQLTASSELSLASVNSNSAKEWRALSNEQKQQYNEEAKAMQDQSRGVNTKKELAKMINRLQELV